MSDIVAIGTYGAFTTAGTVPTNVAVGTYGGWSVLDDVEPSSPVGVAQYMLLRVISMVWW